VALFPMFVKLERRPVLVVGAGRVGEAKIRSLLRAGARVWVVAPRATARRFAAKDLQGKFLVVVATPLRDLNGRIVRLARRFGILVNVVDDPSRCDFYCPAVFRRGPLAIAISTEGHSPAFAQRLRRRLERRLDLKLGPALRRLRREREKPLSDSIDPARRRRRLRCLAREIPLGRQI
jgi:precorrin-2 dehydrogenase / sirohydrochlorin ferrochelatase